MQKNRAASRRFVIMIKKGADIMKLTKQTKHGRLEKYIGEHSVITFSIMGEDIHCRRRKIREDLGYTSRAEYIQALLVSGFGGACND